MSWLREASWLRYAVVIAGLAALYYYLASTLMGNMPYASIPAWWKIMWPSGRVSFITWLDTLTAAAMFMAAIPIAFTLLLGFIDHRIRVAFAVGALAAAGAMGSLFASEFSPLHSPPAVSLLVWLDTLEHFLLSFLTVPFLVWIAGALPFNNRLVRSDG